MVAHVHTVAFEGITARPVDVQVHLAGGLPAFTIVGLPDKAVAESRERVRAALHAIGISLPPKRLTINLAPADLPKIGSHFDLPIALGLLAKLNIVPMDVLGRYSVLGELGLDGAVTRIAGTLPAAIAASEAGLGLICPAETGPEAVWAGEELEILSPHNLIALINHFKGTQALSRPAAAAELTPPALPDMSDVKGQESARRALEIAAAGGHNLLMNGPPGAGKSMLAARLPSILPPMQAREMLESSMIASMAGQLAEGRLSRRRPFRAPHHSASMPALVGGGVPVRPGEISLAHRGVLFLDELPEFAPRVLDSLRQPLETGEVIIARASQHVTYPAKFQLIAAMNPCRCGRAGEPGFACSRGQRCAADYQARLSGPLLDRFDMFVQVAAVSAADLVLARPAEPSRAIAGRVEAARARQKRRFERLGHPELHSNAEANGDVLQQIAIPDDSGAALLQQAAAKLQLSARGYHRVLKVARTLADLAGSERIGRAHIAEALAYRAGLMASRQAA
ncbi:MAG: AAA family ATPase [Hyphomicrobiales bacterium]|nr:MAG: AAA family ATPase [Hyphomicrobiales bacterium]